jgi:hypothetical protein
VPTVVEDGAVQVAVIEVLKAALTWVTWFLYNNTLVRKKTKHHSITYIKLLPGNIKTARITGIGIRPTGTYRTPNSCSARCSIGPHLWKVIAVKRVLIIKVKIDFMTRLSPIHPLN